MSEEIYKVTGQECLNYIDKSIGFGSHTSFVFGDASYIVYLQNTKFKVVGSNSDLSLTLDGFKCETTLIKWDFNRNQRVVGLVTGKSDDGGLQVSILGNNLRIVNSGSVSEHSGGCRWYRVKCTLTGKQIYHAEALPPFDYEAQNTYSLYPAYNSVGSLPNGKIDVNNSPNDCIPFDSAVNYEPVSEYYLSAGYFGINVYYNGNVAPASDLYTTLDKNTTLEVGHIEDFGIDIDYPILLCDDPLKVFSGNLYDFLTNLSMQAKGGIPDKLPADTNFDTLEFYPVARKPIRKINQCMIPYNIILTDNEQYALNYLNNGTLPPDAYLYPIDWDSLPRYQEPDDDDTPGNDDNISDDDIRDVTPNPPVIPSFIPQQLSNNNYYWITAPELEDFINWYWNDVGNIQDIDDLLAKFEGLYNNLSQAIINIRFMPVEYDWICKLAEGQTIPQDNIKIAQIEKAGNVDIISKTGKPKVRFIGSQHIPDKYNSFVDLSPYSQLSMYLPFHGFLDLDINIFSGHDIYVYAIYDYMSGTVQYLLYYDDSFLVNTIICKMAVDIPISLQTKSDRDSAIFQNVSSVVGGLMGAGLSIGTGNPMGLLVGANALNSGVASAPLNVKGNVGEQGAFYAPPQCAIILRRPTISKPSQDIWKSKVGQICGKSYTLSNIDGFTTVYNPQITFNGNKNADNVTMKPLQSEIEEIYQLLEKGVIL